MLGLESSDLEPNEYMSYIRTTKSSISVMEYCSLTGTVGVGAGVYEQYVNYWIRTCDDVF